MLVLTADDLFAVRGNSSDRRDSPITIHYMSTSLGLKFAMIKKIRKVDDPDSPIVGFSFCGATVSLLDIHSELLNSD